jgi:hypothetical protein
MAEECLSSDSTILLTFRIIHQNVHKIPSFLFFSFRSFTDYLPDPMNWRSSSLTWYCSLGQDFKLVWRIESPEKNYSGNLSIVSQSPSRPSLPESIHTNYHILYMKIYHMKCKKGEQQGGARRRSTHCTEGGGLTHLLHSMAAAHFSTKP